MTFGHQFTLFQMTDLRGEMRGMRIVRHHHDGLSELLIQPLQSVRTSCRGLRVQIAGWFVRQNQIRIGHDSARDRHALFLAARKLPRKMREPVAQADQIKRGRGVLHPLGFLERGQLQRKFDVLNRVEHGNQVEAWNTNPTCSLRQ